MLALIHGAGMHGGVWDGVAADLRQRGHDVVCLDLPGHGANPAPPVPSVALMAEALADQLAQIAGAGRWVIGGHSLGSAVALALAASGRVDVAGTILMSPASRFLVNPALLAASRDDPAAAASLIARFCLPRGLDPNGERGQHLIGLSQDILLASLARDPGLLHQDLSACAGWEDGPYLATSVACPAALICGTLDRLTPLIDAQALADQMGAKMHSLAEVGHMPMYEVREALVAHIHDITAGMSQ